MAGSALVGTPPAERSLASPVAFDQAGYACVPQLLDGDELPTARALARDAIDGPSQGSCERPHNTLVPLDHTSPLVELALASDRRIAAVADTVGATDLRWISGYVSVKEPQSGPLWWHQDWWCWDHPVAFRRGAPQIAVLCPLTGTTAATGALRVLPGTHRRSIALHASLPEAHAADAGEVPPEHPAVSDHPDQTTLALAAGDALVLDYRLLHGSHPNTTDQRRVVLLLTFTPHWSHLPPDVRSHLIQHTAQPTSLRDPEIRPAVAPLLPDYAEPRRDLPLNRTAPDHFRTG